MHEITSNATREGHYVDKSKILPLPPPDKTFHLSCDHLKDTGRKGKFTRNAHFQMKNSLCLYICFVRSSWKSMRKDFFFNAWFELAQQLSVGSGAALESQLLFGIKAASILFEVQAIVSVV